MSVVKNVSRLVGMLIVLMLLAACAEKDEAEVLVGNWKPDENFPTIVEYVAFAEDGSYRHYTDRKATPPNPGNDTVVGIPRYGGNYTVEASHIELLGSGGPDGGFLCNGDREYWEITAIAENEFTIKVIDDECHRLNPGSHDAMKSDVITFVRCVPEPRDNLPYVDCIAVDE